jgi:branched-chain amino acid transport system substrate-binding protein
MKKNWISVAILATLALAVLLVITQSRKETQEIRVGAILPLTGNNGIFGQWIKNGIDLGIEEIEKNNPELTDKIKISYEDSQNDAKLGVASLNKLLAMNKVNVVISAMSKVVIPLIPIIEEKKIPLLVQDVTYPGITKRGLMIFRHFIQSDREADVIARYAKSALGVKSAGILYVNDEAGLGAKEAFLKAFSAANGKVSLVESYESSDTDMKSQIAKLVSLKSDAIFLFGNGPSWAISLRQIKELGYKGIILTNTAMYIPNFRQMAGAESVEGVYFTYPYMDTASPSVKRFINLYVKKYGVRPSIESAYAWDLILILANAALSKGNTMYEKLLSVKNIEGAFGSIEIPKDRDIRTKVGLGYVKNGEITTLKVED